MSIETKEKEEEEEEEEDTCNMRLTSLLRER